jgi:hypothetical protein
MTATARASTLYGHNAVGVNTHIPSPQILEFVKALGVQWIRVDNNWFHHGNPCSDAIEFLPALDTAVNAAIQNGLYVYMTLSYTAACGSTGGNDDRDFNDVPAKRMVIAHVSQIRAEHQTIIHSQFAAPRRHGWKTGDEDVIDVLISRTLEKS